MKKWFKRLKNQAGMTLVELLAVVVILGIVAAIAVPSIGNIIDNSKKDAHVSNALLIINATQLGVTTNALEKGEKYTLADLVNAGVLAAVPKDPDSDTSSYAVESFVKSNDNGKISIFLTGSDRRIGTDAKPATQDEINDKGRNIVKDK
ncbi:type II secretion system protein [Chungangia koreensis]|uniref:Type II secretion system protein n=1 Tax=Chungangia koreensis TaxID=752657 RepID=A0ABV8X4L7_9LACT